jgi:hypothetical protein
VGYKAGAIRTSDKSDRLRARGNAGILDTADDRADGGLRIGNRAGSFYVRKWPDDTCGVGIPTNNDAPPRLGIQTA